MSTRSKDGSNKQPQAILFDLDGVLVDVGEVIWVMYQKAREKYVVTEYETKERLLSDLEPSLWQSLRKIGIPLWKLPLVMMTIKHWLHASYKPPLLPGMMTVIPNLARKYPLGVVSSNYQRIVERILQQHRLRTCFRLVTGGSLSGTKYKALQAAAASLCIPTKGILFITDTPRDVREAKALGYRVIGVSWGLGSRQSLLNAGAEKVITEPKHLLREVNG